MQLEVIKVSNHKKIYRVKDVENKMVAVAVKCHNVGNSFHNSNENYQTGKKTKCERNRFAQTVSRSKTSQPHKKNGIKSFKKIQYRHITR